MNPIWTILLLALFGCLGAAYPEKGRWSFTRTSPYPQAVLVSKSIFKEGKIEVQLICDQLVDSEILHVTWYLEKLSCWRDMIEQGLRELDPNTLVTKLQLSHKVNNRTIVDILSQERIYCNDKGTYLSFSDQKLHAADDQAPISANTLPDPKGIQTGEEDALDSKRSAVAPTMNPSTMYVVPADGLYRLMVGVARETESLTNLSVTINIDIHSDYGYLSAADYPLLVFYSVMCGVYVLYGIGWLVVSFMRWKELLRVQYWIGGVILLGMIEKAVFTGFYEDVNDQGLKLPRMLVFAEIVSCAKRTVSRMLVIIVSFGFGIVKPRLGVVLHRVIAVGVLYFVLASFEACSHALRSNVSLVEQRQSQMMQFAEIPLAFLDTAICYWVFSALINTTRTLRLRRNHRKLQLYKHFTNTLIFSVFVSFIFMLWVIAYQNMDACLEDWKQIWVTTAFWHIFFAIILLVIMVLWRPTNNNQRFAFSPLLDEASEDEEETENLVAADVSDTMKLRPTRSSNSSPRESKAVADDLQWLDENIPSAMVDSGMAAVVDSDEEIIITKFEMSKMQ